MWILLIFTLICCCTVLNGRGIVLKSIGGNLNSLHQRSNQLGGEDSKGPTEVIQLLGTTVAFVNGDSVILCVDSKASIGNFVDSFHAKKVLPLTDSIVATMAGAAADCAFWLNQVAKDAQILEYDQGSRLRVQVVARLLALKLREYSGRGLSAVTLVGGHDSTGPSVYYVDDDGTCVRGDLFCVGSGASLAYSLLDSSDVASTDYGNAHTNRGLAELSRGEAINRALRAMRFATVRDGYSGGVIQVLEVNSTGTHVIGRADSSGLDVSLSRM